MSSLNTEIADLKGKLKVAEIDQKTLTKVFINQEDMYKMEIEKLKAEVEALKDDGSMPLTMEPAPDFSSLQPDLVDVQGDTTQEVPLDTGMDTNEERSTISE